VTESGSGSITWSNVPSAGASITSTNVSGTTATWFSWDLSSYIQAEKTAGVNTVSIEIAGTTNTSGNADFNSREASSNQPQLVITSAVAPTVATAASASPSPVTGTTTALSVLGADSGGESNLTYTWAATSVPSGASAPTFSANGTNAAKNATATFSKAGAYTFQATIKNAGGGTVTSSVSVTLSQTQSGAPVLSPATATVADGAPQQFTAAVPDQFGQALVSPAIIWSIASGAIESINSTGLYTAPASGSQTDTVRATAGGLTGAATASVSAIATPSDDAYVLDGSPDTNFGSATSLQVKYNTSAGVNREAYLKFPISSFSSIGSAILRLYGDDNGTTQNVSVTTDDSNNNSWSESTITWNNRPTIANATLATVTTTGTTNAWYTWDISSYIQAQKAAGATSVTLVLRGSASSNLYFAFSSKEGSNAPQLVVTPAANAAPTVATAAAASPSPVTGTTASLSVLGADDGGEPSLTYAWTATSVPTGASAPTFSANGTNAAKNATATFTKAGAYTLQATITDSQGLTSTSSVNVTVNQTLTTIAVTPSGTTTVSESATQQFAASAKDQFGVALTSQPTFTWTTSGVGSVSSTGLYTAPGSTGSATVTATSGSVSGNASLTVSNGPSVVTPAAASPSTVTGTTTSLSVLGSDPAGESSLTYLWAIPASPPARPSR
jgi:hypothetical protein